MSIPSSSRFMPTRSTANALFRLFHLHFRLSRAEAGWAVSFHSVGQICELTRTAYEDMEIAAEFHQRLGEIPGGWRTRQPTGALLRLICQLSAAPSPRAFWLGVFEVVKPALLAACVQHHDATHGVMDTRTVEVLQMAWRVQQDQLDRNRVGTDLISAEAGEQASARDWCDHLKKLMASAGGLLGMDDAQPNGGEDYPAHDVATEMHLEAAQEQRWHFEESPPLGNAQDANYFLNTEIAAVPMLGRLLYSVDRMPYEFYFDTARHMWDEVRHFRMGRNRMLELGLDPRRYAIPVGHYNAHATLSPLESYCQLVLIGEANSFEYKLKWKKECLELGDEKSSVQQDFDIVDEQRHVGYGKKWIPIMRQLMKDPRSIEQITTEADVRVKAAKIAGMRAAGELVPDSVLDVEGTAGLIRRLGGKEQLRSMAAEYPDD